MSRVYDSWERLVEATLKREELRQIALCESLSSSSSADLSSPFSFDISLDEDSDDESSNKIEPMTFTFHEMAAATRNFHGECLLEERRFGRLYKGRLRGSGHVVAIKQIGLRNREDGITEFLTEVLMLRELDHPNIVKVLGYCADGDQRLLVFKYMPLGSLSNHLHDPITDKKHLDWNTRMKIAAGVAKGLEYLHNQARPPVIHRNVKTSNIFLGRMYQPKLSNFGLAERGPVGDKTYVSTRVMGSYGYCAPEYAMTGMLTTKVDVYSFGVVLLEIISGRKAIAILETGEEQHLVPWARPLLKDRRNFPDIVDPALQGQYPVAGLRQALDIAGMCLQEQANLRPSMADVAAALIYLSSQKTLKRVMFRTPPRTWRQWWI